MENYIATLASKLEYNAVDQLMFIEGEAIAPGTYTGVDGHTVTWEAPVLSSAATTLPKKPILYIHTEEDGDEVRSVVGYVSGFEDTEGQVRYKGVIYDDVVFPFIENKTFDAVSPEIDFMADKKEDGSYLATQAKFSSLVLTGIPANERASIDKHGFIHVALEEKKSKMSTNDKPLKDLTAEEKLEFARDYIKENREAFPEYVDKPDEKPPENPPAPVEGLEDLKKDFKAIQDENTALKTAVSYFQGLELAKLEEEIKKIDDEFKAEEFLEGVTDFNVKRTKLEKHAASLNRLIPKLKLELGPDRKPDNKQTEEMKRAVLERFSGDKQKAAEYFPGLFDTKDADELAQLRAILKGAG